MSAALRNFSSFVWRSCRLATEGDWRYYTWIGVLFAACVLGMNAYARQFSEGLIASGMSDQVAWGVYIANFTFLVGVADAAVMLVIPVYLYKREELQDFVVFGILLAIVAILMCLVFVMVDLGRPDRLWHMIPSMGKFNFPESLLSWDVIVLNGYLAMNIYICGYLLYRRYQHKPPVGWHYIPWIFLSIFWAIAIHTVTAFLYVGLAGRPFWNNSIVGPRFIASAFVSGPAIVILAMRMVRRVTAAPPATDGVMPRREAHLDQHSSRPATLEDFKTLAKHLPEIGEVPDETLEKCLAGSVVIEANEDEVLLWQGDTDREAFFIIEGRVAVKREETGRLRVVRTVGPGEICGEISALTGSPRTATAIAEEPVTVVRMTATALRRLLDHPRMNHIVRSRMTERLLITDRALLTLRSIVQVSMVVNVFLLLNELFKEFYTGDLHAVSAHYLYFGLHGKAALVPWIWTAVACNLGAMVLLMLPVSRSLKWLDLACVLAIIGVWIEKGMGLVIPGQIPSPLGEIVEYTPSLDETMICFGIWAFGLLCYTVALRVAIPILQGRFSADKGNGEPASPQTAQPVPTP